MIVNSRFLNPKRLGSRDFKTLKETKEPVVPEMSRGCILGGFNFILFWNFNRNQTENNGKKIAFYFLQNV
jgi:hypothetical protein